jgi:hypothetical protein
MEATIKKYLDNRAKTDELFAEKYANPKKSIDECCKYITGEAYAKAKNGCAVISDEEVYGMAVHYYDEETVEIRKAPAGAKVPSKTTKVKLTKAEEEEARKKALNDIYEAERKRLLAKPKKTKTEELQPMLFDF